MKTNDSDKITMTAQEISLSYAAKAFLEQCKARNLSQATLYTYQTHIRYFREYHNSESLVSIGPKTIQGFIIKRQEKGLSDTSIFGELCSIRAFLNWCMAQGYMTEFKIKSIKKRATVKEAYTDDELKILLKKPDVKKCKFSDYQAWAFINFLCGTGMRLNSAVNIRIGDIDFYNDIISVRITKNKKPLVLPLSPTLAQVLKEYLRYRKGEADEYLFCNAYGRQAVGRTYQGIIAKYNKKRGVNKTSIHLFRNTFAKNWILNGGDIFRLQKILGHSSLEMVKIYVTMFGTDIQKDFAKFNPLDRLTSSVDNQRMTMKK